jgi:hypothetical protein
MHISTAGLKFTPRFPRFGLGKQRTREKVHNYTQRVAGCHYFLSPGEGSHQVYMTADGDGVQANDYILLSDEIGSTQYQVEGIEHYGDSPTMWTALLTRC